MNVDEFEQLLRQLKETDWQSVFGGQSILIVNDRFLQTGPANADNACLGLPQGQGVNDLASLRRESLNNAAKLLNNYYLTHALTAEGFRRQVEQLFEIHGVCTFSAAEDGIPDRTIFVEGGEVIAETAESPRHRYGVYCKLDEDMNKDACEAYVRRWLKRGDAHEQYLGMNVCRYNC